MPDIRVEILWALMAAIALMPGVWPLQPHMPEKSSRDDTPSTNACLPCFPGDAT